MPYKKDKQQAYQAAEQAFVEAQEATADVKPTESNYAVLKSRAIREIEEAEQQISKALTVASERQHRQLDEYDQQLNELKQQLRDD